MLTTYRDIYRLKELHQLDINDTEHLIGVSLRRLNLKSEKPLPIRLALLVRLLTIFPELNFLPIYPHPYHLKKTIEEYAPQFPELKPSHSGLHLPLSKVGLLMGMSSWSGRQRYSPEQIHNNHNTRTGRRLELCVARLLKNKGEDGLKRYIHILDQECRARGYENGIHDLMTKQEQPPT